MQFVRGEPGPARSVGILAGAFNPPTIAHLALIDAARGHVDRTLCVIPREFPHKHFHGATLEQRLEMLDRISAAGYQFDVAVSDSGLFIDIARECRRTFQHDLDVAILCGRDAAERIVAWDYGEERAIERMLNEFRLIVAARGGHYEPPESIAHRIEPLRTDVDVDAVSSTEVRRRIASAESWEDLVPEPARDMVRAIYGSSRTRML